MVWILCAACGGAAKPKSTEPVESSAVRELNGAAQAVCACADAECAQAGLEGLLVKQAELENPLDRDGIDAAHDRAVGCYIQKTGITPGAEVVPIVEAAADEVCACGDAACLRGAVERLKGELRAREDAMFTTRDQAALDAAGKRLDACAEKLAPR